MRTSTLNVCLRFLRPTGGVIAPPHFNMSDGRRDCSRANSRSPSSRISRRAHSAAKWVCVVPSTYTRSPQAKSTLRYWGQQVWVVHSFSGDSFPDGSALSFIPTPPPPPTHPLWWGRWGFSGSEYTQAGAAGGGARPLPNAYPRQYFIGFLSKICEKMSTKSHFFARDLQALPKNTHFI